VAAVPAVSGKIPAEITVVHGVRSARPPLARTSASRVPTTRVAVYFEAPRRAPSQGPSYRTVENGHRRRRDLRARVPIVQGEFPVRHIVPARRRD